MNITEMLMKGSVEEANERPKGTFNSKRLGKIIGNDDPVTVEFVALSPRRVQQIRAMMTSKNGDIIINKQVDASLVMIIDAVTNPNLKDDNLCKRFGASTPKDLAEKLFDVEVEPLAQKILSISQPSEEESEEEMVKN